MVFAAYDFIKKCFKLHTYICVNCGVQGEMNEIKNPALKCPKCGKWTVKLLN